MKTFTTINEDLRTEILSLAIPKHLRRRHVYRQNLRQTRQYACGNKRQYTFEYAQEVIERFRRNHNRVMAAYRCRFCQHWHVGNHPNENRNPRVKNNS